MKQERHIAETQATLEALKKLPELLTQLGMQLLAVEERLTTIEEKVTKLVVASTPARNRPKDQES